MKYYAVATDTIRDEPFGLVVRNGSGSVCYGFHAAGSQWADLYNAGEIKTLEEGLPSDIELGHFGPLHFDVEDMLEKSPETIPTPEILTLIESEWLPNNSTGLGLAHVPLVGISKKSRQLALDYKAHAFLTDSRHSSALLKARLSGNSLVPDDSHTRRTAKELLQTKIFILTQPYRHDDAISEEEMRTKALGRQIGRGARRARRIGRAAGRSAAGFDPNARDADLDMLVQEGTAWERPALPRKPDLPGAAGRRTPADRDRSARRMRQGQGLSSSRSDAYYQPDDDPEYEKEYERQWDRFRSAMQDWTLDELTDELPQDGWSKLQDFTATLDEDELEAQLDKPIKDLPEEWQKAIRDLSEAAFNGDPDALMEMDGLRRGPGPPDPYDVARDRRDRGLASRRDDPNLERPTDALTFQQERLADARRRLDKIEADPEGFEPMARADVGWDPEYLTGVIRDTEEEISQLRFIEERLADARRRLDKIEADPEGFEPLARFSMGWDPESLRANIDSYESELYGSRMSNDEDARGGLASQRAAEMADAVEQAKRRPDRRDQSTPDPMWQGPDGDPYRREQQEEVWQDRVNDLMTEEGLSEEDAIEFLAENPDHGFPAYERGGLRSFREFDRSVRKISPKERKRTDREEKEEWKRVVQFIMDEHQERADLMARLYPERSPEDHAPSQRVLSRQEAIDELQRRAGISRILPGGGGIAELRKRTSEKYRADMTARATAARIAEGGKPIPLQYHVADLSSDEILALENVMEEIRERWERASEALIRDARSNPDVLSRPSPSSISLTGKMSPGDELRIIQDLDDSMWSALDAIRKPFSWKPGPSPTGKDRYYQTGRMQFGNRKRVDDTIDFLQALNASQDEPWDDLSDLIGILEGVRDGDKGKYESPNLWIHSGLASRRDDPNLERPTDALTFQQERLADARRRLDKIEADPERFEPMARADVGWDPEYLTGVIRDTEEEISKQRDARMSPSKRRERREWQEEEDRLDDEFAQADREGRVTGGLVRREMTSEEEAELDRTGTVTGGRVTEGSRREWQERMSPSERRERREWQEEEDKLDDEFAQADREGRVTGGLVRREMTSEEEAELDRTGRVTGGRVQRRIPGEEERRRQYRFGFGSRRDDDPRDPDDWREIEAELSELRTHPGAPSEENPGGTPEYWNQPLPGRENDPGGPQTLGEENIGFRRDGRPGDLDDGSESRYAQDPDNWRETQAEIRDMTDQRIEESLNRMTNEMRQEEFTRGTELEDAARQALDDIEWGREAGFRSYIDRDFDPDRDIDPDLHHDDPFIRDQKLNEAIFDDRMTPMTFDAVADKYDMDRIEIRRREQEHMDLLSGQERYAAQPDLNRRIFEDRVGFRMTIEEVAEKYDIDRAEVRMREITHAHGRSSQEKFYTQPNLNRRIAESRMRGMSLDEVAERFNMDPEEVRFREVTYLGTSPEMLQYVEDAERDPSGTSGFRSVRTSERAGETLAQRLERRDRQRTEGGGEAIEAREAPVVDQAKVTALNRQIDTVRDQKIKPLFKRIAAALEEGDDKAIHRLRKQVRPHQEEEAELREQLGEAMGKGRVSKFGYRSSRTTDDWDADWADAREEAETEITELAEKIGIERGRKKPNKKRINELAQQQLAVIEKARERGLRAPTDGAPWSDPDRSAARRVASQRFWSQGGEITDTERRSIDRGGLQSQREPSRARMRTATTQRAARPLGLASRRGDEADKTMMTLPTLYREDSPRQVGTADGEIWDSLTDDAGVMPPAHAKAIEDAADQLEIELMSGRQDISPRANSFESGLAGGNANQHMTYEELFEIAVRKEMIRSGHIGKDDPTPPVTEWRLEQIGRGENTGVRTFEQAFQVQLLERTGTVGQRITTKRKLLDSLQVLQQMRRSGNYEALEHLHPDARRRLLDIARSKDQTFPEKIKGISKTGGKKSTIWGAIAGHDNMDEYKKHVKRRSRGFRQKVPEGEDKGPLRERIGTAVLSPGMPAAWKRRALLAAQRRAAQAGGAGTGGAGPVKQTKQPWERTLSPLETFELKRAKSKAKKIGRLNRDQRLGRIHDNRTSGVRDVDRPLGGAAATTYFAGTGDDLEQWEKVEGALVVDSTFIDRLARLTRVRRGTATGKDKAKKRQKDKDSSRTRDDIIDASWFHAGHSGLPEMVGPEEIQDVIFEEDPDYPGRFKLREGFKPMLRGLGRKKEKDKREGDVYWEQWVRLVSRFVGGEGGEVHGAGENNAEPPVRVRLPNGELSKDPVSKGFMFGGYGSGALTFITPETRLVGWGKLAEINDEAESIVGVLSGAGLIDTEAPTSIKHDGDNFSAAVRAALDAAEKTGDGRLQVKGRADHREPRDPNAPKKILPTGSGFGIGGSTGSTKPMAASWRDTEFGSIVDQVLDLHDSGDLDPTQLEAAWDFLGKLPASVQKSNSREDHFLFDTLPIYGYDAVQRHGGVISLSNRASVMVLDHPVTGDEVTKIIEGLAKEGKLDQARLRELIPSYGSFH